MRHSGFRGCLRSGGRGSGTLRPPGVPRRGSGRSGVGRCPGGSGVHGGGGPLRGLDRRLSEGAVTSSGPDSPPSRLAGRVRGLIRRAGGIDAPGRGGPSGLFGAGVVGVGVLRAGRGGQRQPHHQRGRSCPGAPPRRRSRLQCHRIDATALPAQNTHPLLRRNANRHRKLLRFGAMVTGGGRRSRGRFRGEIGASLGLETDGN